MCEFVGITLDSLLKLVKNGTDGVGRSSAFVAFHTQVWISFTMLLEMDYVAASHTAIKSADFS